MALPRQTEQQDTQTTLQAVPDTTHSKIFGWLGWSLIALLVVATAVLVTRVLGGNEGDGSFDTAEQIRQQQLAPVDGFDVAETQRFASLVPTVDDSSEVAEYNRMRTYGPALGDGSSEAGEYRRMIGLAPTIDHSNDVAEKNRMEGYAPPVSDGSYEFNELRRMIGLAP